MTLRALTIDDFILTSPSHKYKNRVYHVSKILSKSLWTVHGPECHERSYTDPKGGQTSQSEGLVNETLVSMNSSNLPPATILSRSTSQGVFILILD